MRHHKILLAVIPLLTVLIMSSTICALDDITKHRDCMYCGMDRKAYGFSRMLLSYADGTVVGVCSLHCAAIELESHPARNVKRIEVADRNTRTLIDAEKAYWVIGGDKPGVMSRTGTWAFAEKKDAEEFLKEHGGRLASFKDALGGASREIAKGAGAEDDRGHLSHPGQGEVVP
jgi:copper chaperone NosL